MDSTAAAVAVPDIVGAVCACVPMFQCCYYVPVFAEAAAASFNLAGTLFFSFQFQFQSQLCRGAVRLALLMMMIMLINCLLSSHLQIVWPTIKQMSKFNSIIEDC